MKSCSNIKNKGFTIVELLVVIVVIGVLAAITIVSYTGITQRAAVATLQADLQNASTRLGLDYVLNGVYPANEAAANGGQGLPKSAGTTYNYTVNVNTYCISATSTSAASVYHMSSTNRLWYGRLYGYVDANG